MLYLSSVKATIILEIAMETIKNTITIRNAITFLMVGSATIAAFFGYALVMMVAEMLNSAK